MKTLDAKYNLLQFENIIKLPDEPIKLVDVKINKFNSAEIDSNFYSKCSFEYCLDLYLTINNIFAQNIDSIKVIVKKPSADLVPKSSDVLRYDIRFKEKINQFKTKAMIKNEEVGNSMMIKPHASHNTIDFESAPGFGGSVGNKIKTFRQHPGRIDSSFSRRKYRGFTIESMIALHQDNVRMSSILDRAGSILKVPENAYHSQSRSFSSALGKSILLTDEKHSNLGGSNSNIENLALLEVCNIKNGKIPYAQNNRTSSPYFHASTMMQIPGSFLLSGRAQVSIKAYSKGVLVTKKSIPLNHEEKISDVSCITKKPKIMLQQHRGAYEVLVIDDNPDPGNMVLQCSISSPEKMYLTRPKKFDPYTVNAADDERVYKFVLTSDYIKYPFKYILKAARLSESGIVTSSASIILSPSAPIGNRHRPRIGAGCKIVCYNVKSGINGIISDIPWQVKRITVMRQNISEGDANINIGTYTTPGKSIKFKDSSVKRGHSYRYFYVYACEDLTILGSRRNRISISDYSIKHVPATAGYINFSPKVRKNNQSYFLNINIGNNAGNLTKMPLSDFGFSTNLEVMNTPGDFALMFKISAFNIKAGKVDTVSFSNGLSEIDITRYRQDYTHLLIESCMLHRIFATRATSYFSPYYLRYGILPSKPTRSSSDIGVAFNQCRQGDCVLVSLRNTNLNTSRESVKKIEAYNVYKKYNLIKWSMSDIYKLSDESKDVDYFIVVATFCGTEYILGTVERIVSINNYSFVDKKLSKVVGDVQYRVKLVLNDHSIVDSNIKASVSNPFSIPAEMIGENITTGI